MPRPSRGAPQRPGGAACWPTGSPSARNPLTARVLVNRLWQYHFGRGIVRSSSNFGYQGTPPTHPELLDWLASEFVARGWKLKAMHRLMVMSNTYRMSVTAEPAALAKDPENDLFWRFDLRRLTAEEVRDSILAVSGNLNPQKMGGPSVYPIIPREVLAGQSMPGAGWDNSPPEDRNRRSVYIHIKRSLAVPLLAAFDAADTDAPVPSASPPRSRRRPSACSTATSSNEQADVFAADLRRKAGGDPAAPSAACPAADAPARAIAAGDRTRREVHRRGCARSSTSLPDEAPASFCLLALNLNEFIYLD